MVIFSNRIKNCEYIFLSYCVESDFVRFYSLLIYLSLKLDHRAFHEQNLNRAPVGDSKS